MLAMVGAVVRGQGGGVGKGYYSSSAVAFFREAPGNAAGSARSALRIRARFAKAERRARRKPRRRPSCSSILPHRLRGVFTRPRHHVQPRRKKARSRLFTIVICMRQ